MQHVSLINSRTQEFFTLLAQHDEIQFLGVLEVRPRVWLSLVSISKVLMAFEFNRLAYNTDQSQSGKVSKIFIIIKDTQL